jgi:peptidoglycan LD-endopeptidase CwlK
MINSRDIKDLHPYVQEMAEKHIQACKNRGVKIILTSTLRDDEYQKTLYNQGRTAPGNIVTNVSVTGAHGIGIAYDVVPVVDGVAIWDNDDYWKIIGEEGVRLGATWGGNWKSFVDKPHFEYSERLNFSEIRSGKRPSYFNVHWAEKHYKNLIEKGIIIHEKRYDDFITRGEVFALIDRLTGGKDGKI